jgi:ribosomal protein S19
MVQTGAQRANCQHSDPVQLFEEIIGHKLSELAKK